MTAAASLERKAYIITGPTSGIGRRTALELAKHGTVVLVGRDRGKLDEMQKIIKQKGQHAVSSSIWPLPLPTRGVGAFVAMRMARTMPGCARPFAARCGRMVSCQRKSPGEG